MYCPQCATPHTDGAKFCRSCGTEMAAVVQVLSGGAAVQPAEDEEKKSEPVTVGDWLAKHDEGVRGVSTGITMLLVSALIGLAMALFVPGDVPWMLVWMVFFGWMACWGGIEMGNGIGNVLVSRSRLRTLRHPGADAPITHPPQQLPAAAEPATTANTTAFRSSPPVSVTEGTTRQLDDP